MGKTRQKKPVLPINTGEIVVSALKKLMKNTGWTARTIIKFIKIEYRISDPTISGKVSRALKRGVRLGMLQMDRGRYRLNNMAELVRTVKSSEIRAKQQYALRLQSPEPSSASMVDQFKS